MGISNHRINHFAASMPPARRSALAIPLGEDGIPTTISNLCDLCVLCGSNNVPFHYDADGNMTADERGWHYFWNGENRMVCASNAEVVVTYAYDHRGRMVRKTVANGVAVPKSVAYLWDDWNIIRETATGLSTFQPFNFSTDYVWGLDIDGTLQGAGGVGGLLAVIRDDGVFLPAYDANGNITEYVATNGAVVAHYEYSAFGEPVVSSGELASTFTHQFSTKPYCATTGFSEYQMRKYRPNIGRWMSRDPLLHSALMANFSLAAMTAATSEFDYNYVNNEAVYNVDILGLSSLSIGESGALGWFDKPCDPCESQKCQKLCKYLGSGFHGYKVAYCLQGIFSVKCKCLGKCNLLVDMPDPPKTGDGHTCEYDCGGFIHSIKMQGPCPNPGWYGL